MCLSRVIQLQWTPSASYLTAERTRPIARFISLVHTRWLLMDTSWRRSAPVISGMSVRLCFKCVRTVPNPYFLSLTVLQLIEKANQTQKRRWGFRATFQIMGPALNLKERVDVLEKLAESLKSTQIGGGIWSSLTGPSKRGARPTFYSVTCDTTLSCKHGSIFGVTTRRTCCR